MAQILLSKVTFVSLRALFDGKYSKCDKTRNLFRRILLDLC